MTDKTYLFDELLTEPNLRSKVYELTELDEAPMVCVELTARRGNDWFFARRWVSIGGSRRLLYRLVDDCERWGFRFAVATGAADEAAAPSPTIHTRASEFVAALDAEEREIYHELFPEETRLLAAGYDWDARSVWIDGRALTPDAYGRILERSDGFLWEWVRVDEEFTWRRYPLERARDHPRLASEATAQAA
jgi:hypothetical protein